MNAIALHEDKEHYASAQERSGADVKTAVLDEDAMDLDQPLVEPVVVAAASGTMACSTTLPWTPSSFLR